MSTLPLFNNTALTHTYGPLASEFTTPDGYLESGRGVPTSGFNGVRDALSGDYMGSQIHNRATGEVYAPVSTGVSALPGLFGIPTAIGNEFDANFVVPAGASPANPLRELSDFDFVIGGNSLQSQVQNGAYRFLVDVTSSTGASLHGQLQWDAAKGQYDVVTQHANSLGQGNATAHVLIGDNAGGAHSAQNSEQGIFFGGSMPVHGSTEDITLTEVSVAGVPIAAVHDHILFC